MHGMQLLGPRLRTPVHYLVGASGAGGQQYQQEAAAAGLAAPAKQHGTGF